MPAGILFWVLLVVAVIFGVGGIVVPGNRYVGWGSTLVVFILLALLGWKVFGPVLQ